MIYKLHEKKFWLDEVCGALISRRQNMDSGGTAACTDGVITCAAGMTPSCPIHFGILREVMLSYFVCEELKRRGYTARFIYYWDDYDHFCKIPYYASEKQVNAWLGRPLIAVQDFDGVYASYGVHYMKDFERVLSALNVHPEYNYQSEQYGSGSYVQFLRTVLDKRFEIFDCLYGSETAGERTSFYPIKAYCAGCGKDTTLIESYDKTADTVSYRCECGCSGSYGLSTDFKGKLIWKVNWAMRWAADSVDFEPSGENQLLSAGSYAAASLIVRNVFESPVPLCLPYRFVGTLKTAKVSRKLGRAAVAATLLDVAEPALIRWLFLYDSPQKTLCIDIDEGICSLYKKWDAFAESAAIRLCSAASASERSAARIYRLASDGVPVTAERLPFELLTSAVCYSQHSRNTALRLLYKICKKTEAVSLFERRIEPRFTAAWNYITVYHPEKLVYVKDSLDYHWLNSQPVVYTSILKQFCTELVFPVSASQADRLLHEVCADAAGTGDVKTVKAEACRLLYLLFFGISAGPKLSVLLEVLPENKTAAICRSLDDFSILYDL